MSLTKNTLTAGAVVGAVVGSAVMLTPDTWVKLFVDYPVHEIDHIAVPARSDELKHFIATQSSLEAIWNDPESRLRVDPRLRGIESEGPYRVRVDRIKDGDTVEVTWLSGVCGWLPCPDAKSDIRIWGLDSGETKSGSGQSNADCVAERRAGEAAKAFAKRELLDRKNAENAPEPIVYAYNLRADPYANRWVASLAYRDNAAAPLRYFHIEALQFRNADGSNVFAHYNPIANQVLKRGGKTGFGKRKIWCGPHSERQAGQ